MNKLTISSIALGLSLAFSANVMADNMSKDEYKAAVKSIAAEHKADKKRCDSLSNNVKDICKAEVNGKNKVAKAELEAQYKPSNKATHDVSVAKAEAEYAVSNEKCDDIAGNQKDVCVKEAKAAQVRAKADATAQLKTTKANATAREITVDAHTKAQEKGATARHDAAIDSRNADYKVAIEKCDKFAGDAKSQCVTQAKTQFSK